MSGMSANTEFGAIGAAVAAAIVVPIYFLFNKWIQGGVYRNDNARIDGKVVIITGANTGIGRETALALAKRGGRIYLACRNMVKADTARIKIIHQSGNRNIFTKKLDLNSFESIRKFVEEFKKCETKLHILINNAGIISRIEREETSDGLELQIGTNHFGHFLLTNLLLPMLKDSAPARIITVSSRGHKLGKINREDLQLKNSYTQLTSYNQSKLANILFSRELSKRLDGTGVTSNSLHPGVVHTEIIRHLGIVPYLLIQSLRIMFKNLTSATQTSIMLAVEPKLENVSGKYFADCAIAPESKLAQDDDTAAWLWEISEQITKLK